MQSRLSKLEISDVFAPNSIAVNYILSPTNLPNPAYIRNPNVGFAKVFVVYIF